MALPVNLVQAVERACQLASEAVLWPGFRPERVPLVLHGGGEAYLLGHPSPPEGFSPDGEVAGRPLFRGPVLPEMMANTAQEVAGALSALVMLPTEPLTDPDRFGRLLLHEAFHVFQQEALPHPGWDGPRMLEAMGRYPENDPPNNALAIVENRLLSAALAGGEGAVSAFLSVRRHRHGRLNRRGLAELVGYERFVEYNEGTPTYIEVRAGLPVAELRERLAACSRGGKWAGYQRFYYTGAALALILDRLMAGWQERFARGGATLEGLVRAAVAEPLPPVSQVLEEQAFRPILDEEERLERERRERVAGLLAQLREGPGVQVEISLPPTVFGVMWDPRSVLNLGDGVRLHTTRCGALGPDGLRVQLEGLCLEEPGAEGRRLTLRLPVRPAVEQGERFRALAPGLSIEA
ncbi:MAG: hypothetical protein ACOY93_15060, partial [Bacillota bacterium]